MPHRERGAGPGLLLQDAQEGVADDVEAGSCVPSNGRSDMGVTLAEWIALRGRFAPRLR